MFQSIRNLFLWRCLSNRDENAEEISARYDAQRETVTNKKDSHGENNLSQRKSPTKRWAFLSRFKKKSTDNEPDDIFIPSLHLDRLSQDYEEFIDRELRSIMRKHRRKRATNKTNKKVNQSKLRNQGPPVARRPAHTLTQEGSSKDTSNPICNNNTVRPPSPACSTPEPVKDHSTTPSQPPYATALSTPPPVDRSLKPKHLLNQVEQESNVYLELKSDVVEYLELDLQNTNTVRRHTTSPSSDYAEIDFVKTEAFHLIVAAVVEKYENKD